MSFEDVQSRISKSNRVELDLGNLGLTEFPLDVLTNANMLSLEKINLGGNKLKTLPADIAKFKMLKTLFFAGNEFEEIPPVLGQLSNLFMLSFKGCKVSRVDPASLSPSVEWLILTDNMIDSLPRTIGKLTKLRKVMLSGNRLSSLPDEMKNCRNIELMRLSSNQFSVVPSWLFDLPKLSWLALSGNPISTKEDLTISDVDYNDFEIKEVLGEGTSGIVSRARWRSKNMDVALKMFKAVSTSDGDPREEMKASLHVGKHPNTIEVYGRTTNGKLSGLVMSVMAPSYKSLGKPPSFTTVTRDNYEESASFTMKEVLDILYGIASVGAHLHQRGLSHGDIYAHNILVDKSDVPSHQKQPALLCDYGAATFYDRKVMNMEPIEVRAWGILADELISLGTKEEMEESGKKTIVDIQLPKLKDLVAKCQSESIRERPSFAIITETMRENICTSLSSIPDTSRDVVFGDVPAEPITMYHIAGILVIFSVVVAAFRSFRVSSLFNKDSCTKKEG